MPRRATDHEAPPAVAKARARRAAARKASQLLRQTQATPATWTQYLLARPRVSVEMLLVATSVFFVVASNRAFWHAAETAGLLTGPGGPVTAFSLFVLLAAVHIIGLSVLLTRHITKAVLGMLLVAAAALSHVADGGGSPLSGADMHQALHSNVLADPQRVWPGVGAIAWQVILPWLLLWRVRLIPFPRAHTAARRGMVVLMALAGIAAVVSLPTDALARLRHDPAELRYLMTPANLLALRYHTGSDSDGTRVPEDPPPATTGGASSGQPFAPTGRARAVEPAPSVASPDASRATPPRSTTTPRAESERR